MAIEVYHSEYGDVYRCIGCCKDDYKNIATSRFYRKQSGIVRLRLRKVPITMQKPALKALKMAERRLGREIVVTGSLRTCELQAALYKSDPNRYASPNVGVHCQGLAIDVSTADPELKTRVRAVLEKEHFHQSRPDDEPWHFSYKVTA